MTTISACRSSGGYDVHYEEDPRWDGKAYRVRGWSAVAWQVLGWHVTAEGERTGLVVAWMVGDDEPHLIRPGDLQRIRRGSYCGACGQIGCTHGRSR